MGMGANKLGFADVIWGLGIVCGLVPISAMGLGGVYDLAEVGSRKFRVCMMLRRTSEKSRNIGDNVLTCAMTSWHICATLGEVGAIS